MFRRFASHIFRHHLRRSRRSGQASRCGHWCLSPYRYRRIPRFHEGTRLEGAEPQQSDSRARENLWSISQEKVGINAHSHTRQIRVPAGFAINSAHLQQWPHLPPPMASPRLHATHGGKRGVSLPIWAKWQKLAKEASSVAPSLISCFTFCCVVKRT